jgi:hypothetical protein
VPSVVENARFNFPASIVVALVAMGAFGWAARTGSVALLIAVAVVQALVGFGWVYGYALPGRRGALTLAAMASAAADVVVSVWPHGRLGALLAVFGLAMPTLFVHQLSRGAVRVRVLESLGGVALLVLTEVSMTALLQLRHEFARGHIGDDVVFGVIIIGFGALVVGFLVDLIVTVPRFDADVPRGLLGLIASAGFGGSTGYLTLRHSAEFAGGRGGYAGAALGAIIGLLAVAVAFIDADLPVVADGFPRRIRPVLAVLIPFCLLAPVAFLICLAIRT